MKPKINEAIKLLTAEADRFKQLAKDCALAALLNPGQRAANERAAQDHLLRAETYKAAARIVLG